MTNIEISEVDTRSIISEEAMQRYKNSEHNNAKLTDEEIELLFCDKKSWDVELHNKVYYEFQEVLKKLNQQQKNISYSNIVFLHTDIFDINFDSENEISRINFKNCIFYTKLNTYDKIFKKLSLSFNGCFFYDKLIFEYLNSIYFNECRFYKEVKINTEFNLSCKNSFFLEKNIDEQISLNAENIKLINMIFLGQVNILEKCHEIEIQQSEFNDFEFESNINTLCNKIYIFDSLFKRMFHLKSINSKSLFIIESKFESNSEYNITIQGKEILDFRIHDVEINEMMTIDINIDECSLNKIKSKKISFYDLNKNRIKQLYFISNEIKEEIKFCPVENGKIESSKISGKVFYYGALDNAKLDITKSIIKECHISEILTLYLDGLEIEDIAGYAISTNNTKVVVKNSKISNICSFHNFSELKVYDLESKIINAYECLKISIYNSVIIESASLGDIKTIKLYESKFNKLVIFFIKDAHIFLFSNKINDEFLCLGSQLKKLEILNTKINKRILLNYISITDICILSESSFENSFEMRLASIKRLGIYKSKFKEIDFDCSFIDQIKFSQVKGLNEENQEEKLSNKHFVSKESLDYFI